MADQLYTVCGPNGAVAAHLTLADAGRVIVTDDGAERAQYEEALADWQGL